MRSERWQLILLQGVDENFGVAEGLLDLKSLKGTMTGMDIFEAVSDLIEKMALNERSRVAL